MATVTIPQIASYLATYVKAYRDEYRRFVEPSPTGGGYPHQLQVSPYIYSKQLLCFVARDGYAIADFSKQPEYKWEIAGGPALVTDFPESRNPKEIIELLKKVGLWGKQIGLYRIVAQSGIPDDVWSGDLGRPVAETDVQVGDVKILITQYDIPWYLLIQRLTFGAFCLILDIKLPEPTSPFWRPRIIRDLGFVPADRNNKRFFHYLELAPHLEAAAWDERSIPTRVTVDLQRDFANAFAMQRPDGGGTISFGVPDLLWVTRFHDRLRILKDTISRFETLLIEKADADEVVFHQFLEENPIILDVYGNLINKPKFVYPPGESPLGKKYVEPDFVVRYPNNSYKLIELERPSKKMGTIRGETRSEVTQSAFQIAEWKTYILKHYDQIKEEFPGISLDYRTMIVISRATEECVGRGRKVRDYLEIVKKQLSVDEIFTYDDLLQRAVSAYDRLSALSIS